MNRNRSKTNMISNTVSKTAKKQSLKGSIDPPQIRSNLVLDHRYRFRTTAAFSGAISPSKILGSLGTMGTVANATVSVLFKCFRLKKVEIWSPPPSQGATSTISLEWLGTANSPSLEVSDTSVSVSRPAHIVGTPPPQSLASFWQIASGTGMMNLVLPSGSILDLSFQLILDDSVIATLTIAVATAVLGEIYYLALDHGTSDLVVPVSLNTTV